MAKREKGSPRTGRALWELQSPEDAAAGISAKKLAPYGRRSASSRNWGRVRNESGDTGDEGEDDYGDTSPPEGFKKGGSVKSHGSGLARRKRR